VGQGAEIVAAGDGAHFGDGEEVAASVFLGREPALEHGFDEGEVILHFRREVAGSIGHRDLAVVAVERAEMELLRGLHEVGADEEALGVVVGAEV